MIVVKILRALALSRPPLIIFILSLFAILATVLSLIFYVRLNEKLPNFNSNKSWNSFINHLTHEQFCVVHHNMSNVTSDVYSFKNVTSLYKSSVLIVNADLSANLHQYLKTQSKEHTLTFVGSFEPSGWEPSCGFSSGEYNKTIILTLELPAITNSSQVLSCLTVTGHHSIFAEGEMSAHSQLCPIANISTINAGELLTFNHSAASDSQLSSVKHCSKEDSIHFFYDNIPEKTTFLSVDERLNIASHLLHAVYILLIFILVVLLFGALQGREVLLSGHHLIIDKDQFPS